MRDDRRHHEVAVALYLNARSAGRDAARRIDRRTFITARGQSGRLASGIDTANLHRHRGETGKAEHQYHDQSGDRQCRFHRARTGAAD